MAPTLILFVQRYEMGVKAWYCIIEPEGWMASWRSVCARTKDEVDLARTDRGARLVPGLHPCIPTRGNNDEVYTNMVSRTRWMRY